MLREGWSLACSQVALKMLCCSESVMLVRMELGEESAAVLKVEASEVPKRDRNEFENFDFFR